MVRRCRGCGDTAKRRAFGGRCVGGRQGFAANGGDRVANKSNPVVPQACRAIAPAGFWRFIYCYERRTEQSDLIIPGQSRRADR